jgi:CRISPR/Cas system-associated exonuclease Cas4 (RecB family)
MVLTKKTKNSEVKKAIVKYLDYDEERTVSYNPFVDLKIKKIIEEITGMLESEKPPKMVKNNKCLYCSLRKVCGELN